MAGRPKSENDTAGKQQNLKKYCGLSQRVNTQKEIKS